MIRNRNRNRTEGKRALKRERTGEKMRYDNY